MSDFFIGWSISTILSVLEMVIKNPENKDKYKRQMKKIVRKILEVYPEFGEE